MASATSPLSLTMMESPTMSSDSFDRSDTIRVKTGGRGPTAHFYSGNSVPWSDVQLMNQQQQQQSQRQGNGQIDYNNDDVDLLTLSDYEPEFYHTALFSPQAVARQQKFRVLGTVGLVGLTFFVSCGGPLGAEPLISAGGPLVGLTAMVCYVAFCVFPFTCVLAELCSAFPENGGYSVWVTTTFGPFWGIQIGYWSWVASVLNNALYPGVVYSIIVEAYGFELSSSVAQYFVKVAIACILCAPSLLSVRFAAFAAVTLLAVISIIVLIFSTWGFVTGDHAWDHLLEYRPVGDSSRLSSGDREEDSAEIDWVLLVNTLYWNFDGFYDASIMGGEVLNPARTFPRVLFFTVSITFAMYLFPLVSAVTSNAYPWLEFDEDSFPSIAKAIGGPGLNQLMLLTSLLGAMGLFSATMMMKSFQLLGLAQMRLIPSAFRYRHPRFETPLYAVLLSLVVTALLLLVEYESILGMTNALSAAIQVSIVLSMLKLRKVLPYIPRPAKVPGGFTLLCCLLLPTTGVFLYILFTTLFDPQSALVLCVLVVPGVVYGIFKHRRMRAEMRNRARQEMALQQASVISGFMQP